ncbi:hypothetical protein CSKR_112470 [Clonorchis sinensis]|uniref:Uncharacterized protein n=1 Tax=Clonorchis sinensis TaxID=79923 RepID=A0A419PLL6_CLOSI|nr:hypothetical protein CSKR_112470 [Clonorchis sinensis]
MEETIRALLLFHMNWCLLAEWTNFVSEAEAATATSPFTEFNKTLQQPTTSFVLLEAHQVVRIYSPYQDVQPKFPCMDKVLMHLGFCGIGILFIFTPLSFERSSSCSGVIIPVNPHQREALDSSFALIRAHQQCISSGRAGI